MLGSQSIVDPHQRHVYRQSAECKPHGCQRQQRYVWTRGPGTSRHVQRDTSSSRYRTLQNACQTLMDRLKPIRAAISSASWPELVMAAYTEEVALTATGQGRCDVSLRLPGLTDCCRLYCEQPIDFFSGKGGDIFGYCVYGAACSEVEVDCLTGDHRVRAHSFVQDLTKNIVSCRCFVPT